MVKRLIIALAALLFAGVLPSRADSYVSVDMLPATSGLFNETVTVNFVWDTTTNAVSNVDISSNGPWGLFSTTPQVSFGHGTNALPPGITIFSLTSPGGTVVMDDIFISNFAPVAPTPGTYAGQSYFICNAALPACQATQGSDDTGAETIIVSADSTAAPEPSTLVLLVAGLLGLFFKKS